MAGLVSVIHVFWLKSPQETTRMLATSMGMPCPIKPWSSRAMTSVAENEGTHHG
jgi:hypothetical protein